MTPDVETLREALDEWRDSEARPLANVDGMVSILNAARWALDVLEGAEIDAEGASSARQSPSALLRAVGLSDPMRPDPMRPGLTQGGEK